MTDQTKTDDEVVKRPFADFLREQGKGALHEELTNEMHALIGAINETGKKGVLQISLTFEPNKKNPDMLMVTDDVRARAPKPEKRASIFYTDDDGNVTRSDPNQLTFDGPLREVPAATPANIKEKQA